MARTMTRWQPFQEFADLHERLDRLFDRMGEGESRGFAPAVDVVRKENEIIVRANVPGIKAEDVKIEVEDGLLTISGEHEEKKEEKDERYLRRERSYGSFSRSFPLPQGVDPASIQASGEHGVVEVTIPLPQAPEKKAVEIKAKGS
jgi:HSP20 family protein